jgi:hypothetical protein
MNWSLINLIRCRKPRDEKEVNRRIFRSSSQGESEKNSTEQANNAKCTKNSSNITLELRIDIPLGVGQKHHTMDIETVRRLLEAKGRAN